jgi:hypothetical protein
MARMGISFEVQRSDFVSMYVGSWGARIAMAPGLLLILIGIPTNPKFPLTDSLFFLIPGAVLLVAGPFALAWILMGMYGANRVAGQTVHLTIDDEGIHGWPIAEYVDTSWARAGRARRLRGVITVPFHQFGTRAGWVPIPERAIDPERRDELMALLSARARLKISRKAG